MRNITFSAFLAVAVLICVAGAAHALGELDGTQYSIVLSTGTTTEGDQLIFMTGEMESVSCRERGFGPAIYYTEPMASGGMTFTATSTSSSEGTMTWTGVSAIGTISGQATWSKEGQDDITYTFSGADSTILDGRSYAVETVSGDELSRDLLIFSAGTFESTDCQQYGFGPALVGVEASMDSVSFVALTHSDVEGEITWTGTVVGNTISGASVWTKDGQDDVIFSFSGALDAP